MRKLNVEVNKEMLKETKGGWNRCSICGQNVSGGVLAKYSHCTQHAWRAVFPFWDLLEVCFGIVK